MPTIHSLPLFFLVGFYVLARLTKWRGAWMGAFLSAGLLMCLSMSTVLNRHGHDIVANATLIVGVVLTGLIGWRLKR
ncbi:MAG: hypothetical protein RLZZ324_890 [Candidatus Parcubacteria bacterium]